MMTLHLQCDGEAKSWTFYGRHPRCPVRIESRTLNELRNEARRQGWTCTPERDLCPFCRPTEPAPDEPTPRLDDPEPTLLIV